MAIGGVNQDRISEVLRTHLTPSAHITTPERLFGRAKKLVQIERAFNSEGRHIFIYGDRGIGKTSLAMTAAYLHQDTAEEPVYVLCSETSTFSDIIYAVGCNALPMRERMEKSGEKSRLALNFAGVGGSYQSGAAPTAMFEPPKDINEASNIIRYMNERRSGTTIVVIDELERMKSDVEKTKLAEFINSISSIQTNTKFILCGVGQTAEELLGSHRSATRKLEMVPLDRISHDELWKIVSTAAESLGVLVDSSFLMRASVLSDGFPHYVHLIGESLFWAMFDDEEIVSKASSEHFRLAVTGAIQRTAVEHQSAYRKATEKTKNTKEYEHALWALADKTETRRQITAIYDDSYVRIARSTGMTDRMDRSKFNQRMLTLKSPAHGEIVRGFGAGWFAFNETILRGFVRLVAEEQGVTLATSVSQ